MGIKTATIKILASSLAAGLLVMLAVSAVTSPAVSAQAECGDTVIVAEGDTLASIARRCGRMLAALLQANPEISDPDQLSAGQEVTIPAAEALTPLVTIYPARGAPGTTVTLIANGFPPNMPVIVGIGPVDSEYWDDHEATTDRSGALLAEITIPEATPGVDGWVIVVASPDGDVRALSYPFLVTDEETEGGRLFNRTTIYLIAMNDNGQSGEAVGCGDSVVPVEVAIEPTRAPLTAAFERLLALDEPYYGESGLYNALAQSDFTLNGITIEDGVATIHLSGMLSQGGECDTPRIEAQLLRTALQYDTVREAAIFINGQPMEEAIW